QSSAEAPGHPRSRSWRLESMPGRRARQWRSSVADSLHPMLPAEAGDAADVRKLSEVSQSQNTQAHSSSFPVAFSRSPVSGWAPAAGQYRPSLKKELRWRGLDRRRLLQYGPDSERASVSAPPEENDLLYVPRRVLF